VSSERKASFREASRPPESFVEFQQLDALQTRLQARLQQALLGQVGVVGHHLHAQARRTLGHHPADASQPDHAQHLAGDLGAHEVLFLPVPRARAAVRLGHVARQGAQQGDGQFPGGGGVARGGVHDHHPAFRGRGHVHVVHAHSCSAHHHQVACGFEYRARDLGGRAHHQGVHSRHSPDEGGFVHAGTNFGFDTVLEKLLEGGRVQIIADDDARGFQGRAHAGRGKERVSTCGMRRGRGSPHCPRDGPWQPWPHCLQLAWV